MNIYGKCTNPYIDPKGIAHACGQCLTCRKSKSLEWIIRCKHELITNPKAVYLTLTYSPENLHKSAINKMNSYDRRGTLDPNDVTLFIKRLRQKYINKKLRYIYCGEYGEDRWRPHYHMVIWGINFNEISQETLVNTWGLGYVDKSNESVTTNAITYIVSYLNKKKKSKALDKKIYTDNGRIPPFIRMSQGLGKEWANNKKHNWAKTGTIAHNGNQYPIPRYYIKKLHESEGRKIRYEIKTYNAIGKGYKKRYGYKIIKNPNGELTKLLYERQINKIEDDFEKWKKNYKLDKQEANKIINIYRNEHERRIASDIILHEINKHKSNELISKELSYIKNYDAYEKRGRIQETPLKKDTLKQLRAIARKKELTILNGLFGKRNKYELMEIIQGTEASAPITTSRFNGHPVERG
jgi:hypothetical protein